MKKFLLKSKSFVIAFMIANLFFITSAAGQTTYYLTTAGQANPQTPANWNTGGIVGGGTAATVFTGASDVFVISSTITASFPANVTATFAGTLEVDGAIVLGTNLNNSNTTLTVNGTIVFSSLTNQFTYGSSGGAGNNTFVLGNSGTLKTQNSVGIVGVNCSITLNGARTAATLPA
ncbi:hypothetical protein, partial [Ferruginibacter sp.]